MPGMTGLDLLRLVKAVEPATPFILVSGQCDLSTAQGALQAGATNYLLKPFGPSDLLSLVSKYTGDPGIERCGAVREALALSLGVRDTAAGSGCPERILPIRFLPIFDALGFRRFETFQHSLRVAAFTLLIARSLDLDRSALSALETGALLHDIGKAGIPHNVLMKPGQLNDAEWDMMKMHPRLGLDMLAGTFRF